jgi:hypothetical protein
MISVDRCHAKSKAVKPEKSTHSFCVSVAETESRKTQVVSEINGTTLRACSMHRKNDKYSGEMDS